MTGQKTKPERSFSHRSASADDYKKLKTWQVGTLHRGSTSKTEEGKSSPGKETEENGVKEEALRRLKVRQMFKGRKDRTQGSSK